MGNRRPAGALWVEESNRELGEGLKAGDRQQIDKWRLEMQVRNRKMRECPKETDAVGSFALPQMGTLRLTKVAWEFALSFTHYIGC